MGSDLKIARTAHSNALTVLTSDASKNQKLLVMVFPFPGRSGLPGPRIHPSWALPFPPVPGESFLAAK